MASEQGNGGVILEILHPQEGETVLDVTVGLGGHAKAFLASIGKTGRLYAVDADSVNLEAARRNLESEANRVVFVHGNFRDIGRMDIPPLDVIFADLGVSSPHFDDPERGFTFRLEGPLDLRFDRTQGQSASEWLMSASESDITRILREYGELREARRIALAICAAARAEGEMLRTTTGLRTIVERTLGYRAKAALPQVFQALRICVNDELGALDELLAVAPTLLRAGGRMGVISYHSLEDRRVKTHFRAISTPAKDPTTGAVSVESDYRLLTKAIRPTDEEIEKNPRARSAVFRAIERISDPSSRRQAPPAWSDSP